MTPPRPDIFLSYSREDLKVALRFAQALQREGYEVWWDQSLATGQAFEEVTEKALEEARAVVVLWSKHSVGSRWVRAEATQADQGGKLMPVMIEGCKRPIKFELTQTAELAHWDGSTTDPAWRAFVADVKRLVPASNPVPSSGLAAASAIAIPVAVRPGRRLSLLLATALPIIAVIAGGLWLFLRTNEVRRARAEVPRIAALVDAGKINEAFQRSQRVRKRVPDDPMLESLTPLFSMKLSVKSTPEGAQVLARPYDEPDGPWQQLGVTPLPDVTLSRVPHRLKLTRQGYRDVELAIPLLGSVASGSPSIHDQQKLEVTLKTPEELPAEMVFVSGGNTPTGVLAPGKVPAFLIDRHEVTNSQYKEFVDAGGYGRVVYWQGMEFRNGSKVLTLEEARRLFVDSTGRPGPATWELGTFRKGEAEHPVSGLSWYEAVAYARYRGKSLPTAFHWYRAALPDNEILGSLASYIAPLSNYGSTASADVGKYAGLGPFGTYDMFGNVREWVANTGPGEGWVMGGGWDDVVYSYFQVIPVPLMDRSAHNGLRLMRELDADAPAVLRAALVGLGDSRDHTRNKPVSDEVFESYQSQFAYKPGPLDASQPVTMQTTEDWIKQKVTINTGYNDERMDVVLFVPKNVRPPLQPVVFFSGYQMFIFPGTIDSIEPGFAGYPLDYIVKSGRVLVQPVFKGSFERFRAPPNFADAVGTTQKFIEWRWDLGRTLDYLQSRADFDAQHIGYVGTSFGGSYAMPLLAVEPRFKAAVFISGGYPPQRAPALVDSKDYVPRIHIPVLMINGRYDATGPLQTHKIPFFEQLGTASADKKFVVLEFGHGSPPRAETLKETLAWYDKYLGLVNR
jgi:predicted esterase